MVVGAQGVGGLSPCCGPGLGQDLGRGGGAEVDNFSVINFACWNIAGWYHSRPKLDVITNSNIHVIGLVETHLKNNESIDIEGFTWFGKKTEPRYTRRLLEDQVA